ncbi:MAG: SDR family NAD(P)-dependent oxidoreductase [Leptospiraceae bacterium]|nr:SDR family NAD(P)-dependent oxidoreductase [Leptospiraceae bacterium]
MKGRVIITGASSGIGRSLAIEFASKGYALGLTARRYELLKELQLEIKEMFGESIQVELRVLDVTMYREISRVLKELTYALGGLDILVVNAGVARAQFVGTGAFLQDKTVIETNLIGAIATVDSGLEIIRQGKRQGQIVGISSIAGIRGFAGNASYSASKAGFTTYLEALRAETQGENIQITTILPGFIDTPMNSHMPERPFVITVREGAKRILSLIERRVNVAVVPTFPWIFIAWLLKWLPDFLFLKLKLKEK